MTIVVGWRKGRKREMVNSRVSERDFAKKNKTTLRIKLLNYDFFYLSIIIICEHKVIWYQVLLPNINNLYTILWFQVRITI